MKTFGPSRELISAKFFSTWLNSRGLLGRGGGMRFTECHSSALMKSQCEKPYCPLNDVKVCPHHPAVCCVSSQFVLFCCRGCCIKAQQGNGHEETQAPIHMVPSCTHTHIHSYLTNSGLSLYIDQVWTSISGHLKNDRILLQMCFSFFFFF